MANTNLQLYQKCEIIPSRNMALDDIEGYLNSIPSNNKFIDTEFQFIKHALNLTIKVNISQAVMFQDIYNYARIRNDSDPYPFYYFITGQKWLSSQCIEFTLVLDTLSTFIHSDSNGKLLNPFNEKTSIIREHMDRYERKLGSPVRRRNIDRTSEGITAPLQKQYDSLIADSVDLNWYLIYRNKANITPDNLNNPVECFTCAEEPLTLKLREAFPEKTIGIDGTIKSGDIWYWTYEDNGDASFITTEGTIQLSETNRVVYMIRSSEGDKNGYIVVANIYAKEGYEYKYAGNVQIARKSPTIKLINTSYRKIVTSNTPIIDLNAINALPSHNGQSGLAKEIVVKGINEIDRTDSRIIKIIELPYAPDTFSRNELNVVSYNHEHWKYSENLLKLTNLNLKFKHRIFDYNNEYHFNDHLWLNKNEAIIKNIDDSQIAYNTTKSIEYESKLFHSDYYQIKAVYDSFSWTIKLENLIDEVTKLPIYFKASNTINSNMSFNVALEFPDSGVPLSYIEESDYEGYIVARRNNEVLLYNSAYINYIKNGYNYDKKKLEQQNSANWLGTGISVAGALVSGVVGGFTGNPVSAAASISMTTSTISSIANNINSYIGSSRAIEQKLQETKNQAIQIVGSDDIDLLEDYNGNRLHQITYSVSYRMKSLLWDLFFYTGYSHPVQDIPSLHSRIYFNYIQCKPVFTSNFITSTPPEYLEDIMARFEVGVTIYHKPNGSYDFAQQYENWETFFFN